MNVNLIVLISVSYHKMLYICQIEMMIFCFASVAEPFSVYIIVKCIEMKCRNSDWIIIGSTFWGICGFWVGGEGNVFEMPFDNLYYIFN